MPHENQSSFLDKKKGIPLYPGYTAEILETGKDKIRVQFYGDYNHKFGGSNQWYDVDLFSEDAFGIDHRNPNKEENRPMSKERATELMEGEDQIRSTDKPDDVLKISRQAHKRLKSGTRSSPE